LRDREAHVRAAFTPCTATLFSRPQLYSKACILTRVITLFATVTLAASVLFRYSTDYRTPVCIIVSLAAVTFSFRALLTGKFVSGLLFASVLGLFTPFHPTQFTHVRTSILDMATLALFAASPIIIRKSAGPLALKHPTGKL
jgi:hypothetical protein